MTNEDRIDMIECVCEGVKRALAELVIVSKVKRRLRKQPKKVEIKAQQN